MLLKFILQINKIYLNNTLNVYIISSMPRKNIRRRQAQMHLWLDKPILERLQKIARNEGRTVTELCREAIADLLLKRDIKQIIKNKGVK